MEIWLIFGLAELFSAAFWLQLQIWRI